MEPSCDYEYFAFNLDDPDFTVAWDRVRANPFWGGPKAHTVESYIESYKKSVSMIMHHACQEIREIIHNDSIHGIGVSFFPPVFWFPKNFFYYFQNLFILGWSPWQG